MTGNTPSVPANASTATKVIFTIALVLLAIGGVAWPTGVSPLIGEYALAAGGILVTVGGIVHSVWDHSP